MHRSEETTQVLRLPREDAQDVRDVGGPFALLVGSDHHHVVVVPDSHPDTREVETVQFTQQLRGLLDPEVVA